MDTRVLVIFLLASLVTVVIMYSLKKSSVAMTCPQILDVNYSVGTWENGSQTVVLTYNTENVISMDAAITKIEEVDMLGTKSIIYQDTSLTSITLWASDDNGNVNYSIYLIGIGLESNVVADPVEIEVEVTCFVGDVLIATSKGPKMAKDIELDDEIIQQEGVSKVKRIVSHMITNQCKKQDKRIFQKDGLKVTYWHKVKFAGEEEMVIAGEHPLMTEIFPEEEFRVYHFELEHPDHILMVEDAIVESLI